MFVKSSRRNEHTAVHNLIMTKLLFNTCKQEQHIYIFHFFYSSIFHQFHTSHPAGYGGHKVFGVTVNKVFYCIKLQSIIMEYNHSKIYTVPFLCLWQIAVQELQRCRVDPISVGKDSCILLGRAEEASACISWPVENTCKVDLYGGNEYTFVWQTCL